MNADVNIPLAFLAGIISFLSPCVFPLVPSYISYITGVSFEDLSSSDAESKKQHRKATITNSLIFILGFSVVFIILGASSSLSATPAMDGSGSRLTCAAVRTRAMTDCW